jgi:hypothetical protein
MSQTSIKSSMDVAFAGMLADAAQARVDSKANGEASAEIPFGVAVVKGATDNVVKLPSAGGDKFDGVVVHDHSYVPGTNGNLGTTGLKPKTSMNILREGEIWVVVEEAVAPGDRGHFRHTANGGNTQKGAWRKSADGVNTIDATAQTEFRSTAAQGGLAKLYVNAGAKP